MRAPPTTMRCSAIAILSLTAVVSATWNGKFSYPPGIEPLGMAGGNADFIVETFGPSQGPPSDCISVWHPPHPNVYIDDCDNDKDKGWHWVHPGKPKDSDKPDDNLVWTSPISLAICATSPNIQVNLLNLLNPLNRASPTNLISQSSLRRQPLPNGCGQPRPSPKLQSPPSSAVHLPSPTAPAREASITQLSLFLPRQRSALSPSCQFPLRRRRPLLLRRPWYLLPPRRRLRRLHHLRCPMLLRRHLRRLRRLRYL
ncbi:hypothetical protein LY78DRAFT_43249 [Colletotrichum sublineola]|nr:hypothetical protein LY78DRAFT_43249 [Colletotrichum sublineola]